MTDSLLTRRSVLVLLGLCVAGAVGVVLRSVGDETGDDGEPTEPEVRLELGRVEASPELDPDEEAVTLTVIADHGTGFDFTEWTLRDGPGGEVERGEVEEYRFPAGYTRWGGESVRVVTGGDPAEDTNETLHWGADRRVWDPTGDTVIVVNRTGELELEATYPDQT